MAYGRDIDNFLSIGGSQAPRSHSDPVERVLTHRRLGCTTLPHPRLKWCTPIRWSTPRLNDLDPRPPARYASGADVMGYLSRDSLTSLWADS